MRESVLFSSFNAGEMSPLLGSRPDLEKYRAGMALSENAIPRVQGAMMRRGGTRYVSEIKDSSKKSWLVEFIYSVNDAFILEFGDLYIRFYRSRAVFTNGGTPYEIVSPYALADLTDADGAFAIKYVQSGDIVYLAHSAHPPQKLTRNSNTDWTISQLEPDGGPFQDQNTDQGVTVYATGSTAIGSSVTLTASSPIFAAGHVGGLFYIEMLDSRGIKPWFQRMLASAASATKCYSDSKYYLCTADGGTSGTTNPQVTGDVKPTHTAGTFWDGDGADQGTDSYGHIGVAWAYLHPGYAWVKITAFSSSTSVTAEVLSTLPDGVVGSGNATFRWALGAWSDAAGWPDNVTFFRERLTFWKQRFCYCSVAADFENFKAKTFGVTDPSSAVNLQIQSGRGDGVKWVAPAAKMIVGTGGGESVVGEQTANQVFGPGNTNNVPQGEWGSRAVTPAKIGPAVLYVEKSGRAVREIKYDLSSDTYASSDTTDYAEHLFNPSGVLDMAYARKPHSVLWACREDGLLLGLTYSAQQGAMAWVRHPIGSPSLARDADGAATGYAVVESVAVIPTPDASRDDLWLIVKRTINGVTKRYVEYLSTEYRRGDDLALAAYYDAHLTYSGGAVSSVSGLGHLEGCTVGVLADGAAHPDCVVSSGAITLARSASKVVVGLKAPMRGRTMPVEGGARMGSAQGQLKRVNRLRVRVRDTLGGVFGPDFDTLDPLQYRTPGDAMGGAPPLRSEIGLVEFDGDFDMDAAVCWEWDDGFPATLSGLVVELETNEG